MHFTATVTAGGRVTIPKPVRAALQLNAADEAVFRIEESRVVISQF